MRSNEVFSRMTPEEAQAFLEEVRKTAPGVANLALSAAASAFKLRPAFLRKQPPARQAEWMRKALSRTVSVSVAEEVLASYFLEHHLDLLIEWLDLLGIEHDEGQLDEADPDEPKSETIATAIEKFRSGEEPARRELLMRAFAAQGAVDWPSLEAALEK